MKTFNPIENLNKMPGGKVLLVSVAGAILVLGIPVLALENGSALATSATPNQSVATMTARHSAGIDDILKMVDAKVDAEVIKAYIKNSPTYYNPNASEIIALRDRGVSSEIITGLLQHGAELRAQADAARPGRTYQDAAGAYPAAPTYPYAVQPVYPDYAYSYPDYYPYGYYPCGFAYDWGYPWPYFTSFCGFGCGFGFCGHRHFHDGFRVHSFPRHDGAFIHQTFSGRTSFSSARPISFATHSSGFHSSGGSGFHSGGAGGFHSSGRGGFHSSGSFGGHSTGRGR